MRRIVLVSAILAGLLVVLLMACTPPPERTGADETEGVTATNGETETPSETETQTEGEITTTGETGEVAEDTTKGPESTEGEEETMLAPEPVPDNIFGHYETWPPASITDEEVDILRGVVVVMETTKGTMKIRLFPDAAPVHSANFVKLVQEGFYDGLTFHRVMTNFMSQGGDPTGTGSGGPEYTLPAEIGLPHKAGSLAAARLPDQVNPDKRSSSCQFYLVHTDESGSMLDGAYTVYGQIIEGLDVNLSLNVNYTRQGPIPGTTPDRIVRAYIIAG